MKYLRLLITRRRQQLLKRLMSRASRRTSLLIMLGIIAFFLILSHSMFNKTSTGSKSSIRLLIFGDNLLPEPTQAEIDYFASYVNLSFTVEDNFASEEKIGGKGYYVASVSLVNTGDDVIPAKQWQLHGYFMSLVESESYPYPNGFDLNSCGLKIFHVEGSLYRLEPLGSKYLEVKPYETLTCKIKINNFQVSRTDSFPRWYVTGTTTMPKVLNNTDNENLDFVSDFKAENQFKRRIDDGSHPYSPQERYKQDNKGRKDRITRLKIIPTPFRMQVDDQLEMEFFTNTWVIIKDPLFSAEIKYFSEILQMKVKHPKYVNPYKRFISISKRPVSVLFLGKQVTPDEAYTVKGLPDKECILITSNTRQGVFNAFQTIASIVFNSEVGDTVGVPVILPGFYIQDTPRYIYRGLQLDVARNFIEVSEVLRVISVMAMYKMNKLHLHLSDDEGWRLEIPGIPELTKVGSSRCHDPSEEQCIMPMLGSGPLSNNSGSGYYTVEDYKQILAYADERFIRIIPEFSMPGHSRAAIKSIQARNKQAAGTDANMEQFTITDYLDDSNFISEQQFGESLMNPCMESTYTFVDTIMKAVKKMHVSVQPMKCYHFGGDEVAVDAWSGSPQCARMKAIDPAFDVKKHMYDKLVKTAAEHRIAVGTRQDALFADGPDDARVPYDMTAEAYNNTTYAYVWRSPTGPKGLHTAKLLANRGYKVVLSYSSHLSLDHQYEPDPEERGRYSATRKLSTRDVYEFTPYVMYSDNHLDCPSAISNSVECFELTNPDNVIGIEAALWTETVRTDEHVENMLFPRLLAVAERAWHKAAWEGVDGELAEESKQIDWSTFISTVGYLELPRMDKAKIRYRVPPPGATVIDGKVQVSTEFPGLDVEYFSSQSNSWELVSNDLSITEPTKFRTRSTDSSHYSKEILLDPA